MRTYVFGDRTLGSYVHMGTMGAVVIQAVVVGGGRIAQAVCNKFTKKRELLYDIDGNLLDYFAQQVQPADIEGKSTIPRQLLAQQPRPPTTTSSDKVADAMAGYI